MEYHAIFIPACDENDVESNVLSDKLEALKKLNTVKDARMKSFKDKKDAMKFARSGLNTTISESASLLKSPSSQPSNEKGLFRAPKSQDLMKFRKEIEANNLQTVYETVWTNPRYLVSSGDTPSILKEGTRYNALHIAAIYKRPKMAKLILQTIEQPQFVEHLHGNQNDSTAKEVSQILLESYLNTPDKSRNETPLHFASKFGALEVVEVLIAYPLCKMKKNSEGKYPRDIICTRDPDATAERKEAIDALLKERVFVPVLRSSDNTVPAIIGEAFTPSNMPTANHSDPLSPSMEIRAYAGPMDRDQAETFRKRFKTPPRIFPSPQAGSNLNMSYSPKSSSFNSPTHSPHKNSKSMIEFTTSFTSTPKPVVKKKLFHTNGDFEDVTMTEHNDKNGNSVFENGSIDELPEIPTDTVPVYNQYRNPTPLFDSPAPIKHDKNSNHLVNDSSVEGNSGILYLDENGMTFNSENVVNSPSYREKHIRLTDTEKGLETIGRELAQDYNVGWKEFWAFLGTFVDIRSSDGLAKFESFLKSREEVLECNEKNQSPKKNDIVSQLCNGLYSLDLNQEISAESSIKEREKFVPSSPTSSTSVLSLFNDFMLNNQNIGPDLGQGPVNPYLVIEKSCQIYANRLVKTLANKQIQDQHAYEKALLQEIKKLNSLIDSYRRDIRFKEINYQKIHCRYSYLFTWYLMQNNMEVEYLRTHTMLFSKVYALASQFRKNFDDDFTKTHAICLSNFISNFIEKQTKVQNPDSLDTEFACVGAWNSSDIAECRCSFELIFNEKKPSNRHTYRREFRKKLYDNDKRSYQQKLDIWSLRANFQASDEEESDEDKFEDFLSCTDSNSDDDEFFTPPSSPIRTSDSMEDLNDFEESVEEIEEKSYHLFIEGEEPTKVDFDVLNAIGVETNIDESQYPLVGKWHTSMKSLSSKTKEISLKNRFRLFTPKLKFK